LIVAQEKIQWQEPLEHVPRQRKKSRPKERKKLKSFFVLALIVAVAATIGAETINLTVAKGAQVRALEKEVANLQVQNDLLQAQVDKLRSVSRIESAALAMGMEKPAGTVYVSGNLPAVKNQTGVNVPQIATQPPEPEPSVVKQISQLFTSFFASTQR